MRNDRKKGNQFKTNFKTHGKRKAKNNSDRHMTTPFREQPKNGIEVLYRLKTECGKVYLKGKGLCMKQKVACFVSDE